LSAISRLRAGQYPTELQPLLEKAFALSRHRAARPVAFIERKAPDLAELAEILRLSSENGYWTNFGPVCSLLEAALERYLNLPPSRTVVMCSSGTAALFAWIAARQYQAGRKLRWVVSAYGFPSTYIGPLAGAAVLDCAGTAMLDLPALANLDPAAWDGVVLTNVFGLRPDVRGYLELCRKSGKEVVVDNAGLLDGFARNDPGGPVDEILSFHQTKPWGMGEGGCAVVAKDLAPLFRELINPGHRLADAARAGASNSKISDFSCALILQRLLRAPQWSSAYREQAQRVLGIALDCGLAPLAPLDLGTLTPPHLPLLAPRPLAAADLVNPTLVLHKYYKPLSASAPNARAIYDRIVNVPCHPDMAMLTAAEIRACLEKLAAAPVRASSALPLPARDASESRNGRKTRRQTPPPDPVAAGTLLPRRVP
jgi:dTDP-4-amino-4,6-dideoxygalactose transaminase